MDKIEQYGKECLLVEDGETVVGKSIMPDCVFSVDMDLLKTLDDYGLPAPIRSYDVK